MISQERRRWTSCSSSRPKKFIEPGKTLGSQISWHCRSKRENIDFNCQRNGKVHRQTRPSYRVPPAPRVRVLRHTRRGGQRVSNWHTGAVRKRGDHHKTHDGPEAGQTQLRRQPWLSKTVETKVQSLPLVIKLSSPTHVRPAGIPHRLHWR